MLKTLSNRINKLPLVQRIVMMLGVLLFLTWFWDTVLVLPAEKEKKTLVKQQKKKYQKMVLTHTAIGVVLDKYKIDPDAKNKRRFKKLNAEIVLLDKKLKELTSNLIKPTQMTAVLKQMLLRNSGLKLLSLRSLEAEPLIGDDISTVAKDVNEVYRHGFVLTFSGDYISTIRYLQGVESLPWRLYWGRITYEVGEYPNSIIKLTVHSLSLKEGWIGV